MCTEWPQTDLGPTRSKVLNIYVWLVVLCPTFQSVSLYRQQCWKKVHIITLNDIEHYEVKCSPYTRSMFNIEYLNLDLVVVWLKKCVIYAYQSELGCWFMGCVELSCSVSKYDSNYSMLNIDSVRSVSTFESQISIRFAPRPTVFELQAILKQVHQITPKWLWTLQGYR